MQVVQVMATVAVGDEVLTTEEEQALVGFHAGAGIMRSVIDAPRLGRRGELRHRDYESQFVAPGLVFLRRTLA